MSRRATPPALACLAALLALGGCALLGEPRPDPTQFFVLNAVAPPGGAASDLAIGLGPISLPSYLDRPEMARRVDENQIAYDPIRRWAEPLPQNFARVIAADLVQILGPRRIEAFPWFRTAKFDYIVTIAVSRFETQPDGSVKLTVRWTLHGQEDAELLERVVVYTRPVPAPEQTAAALSDLAAELSQEIAAAIQADRAGR
jgi:uncharacterized lipoprotein YmbA